MRILLVDDEPELVFTLAERLEIRGHEVRAVTSGAEALECMHSETYDVAVVDLKMPGMGGLELMTAIREEIPDLPVVLLTGHGESDEQEQIDAMKACALLYKPVYIDVLIKTMKSCTGSTDD